MGRGGKIVLLDLGGVLVEATGRSGLKALLPHLSDAQILERWTRSQAAGLFERGKLSSDAFARRFVDEWGLEIGEAAFLELFASWVTGFFEGAPELIEALRARHHVGCLSNTNAIHWARLRGISSLFDSCFPSHVTGFMKPDHEAYRHALNKLEARANDVYFFDDLEPNVAAAREVGMNAFRVTDFSALTGQLRALGLHDFRR